MLYVQTSLADISRRILLLFLPGALEYLRTQSIHFKLCYSFFFKDDDDRSVLTENDET